MTTLHREHRFSAWRAGAVLLAFGTAILEAQSRAPVASAPAESTSQPTTSRAADGRATALRGTFLELLQEASADLVDRLSPSVVGVTAERLAVGDDRSGDQGDLAEPTPLLGSASTGAGVVIRPDGLILTSEHVVQQAGVIRVTLSDGRCVRAALVSADPRSDLAILRIDAPGLTAAQLGNAAGLRRGHIVFAFGRALEAPSDGQATVSFGLVSAVGCPLPESFGRQEDRDYGDMIQTTARVSPGDSGGPLADIRGNVVGVITAIGRAAGAREGVALAVPVDDYTTGIIHKLLRGERIEYGYLGVRVGSPSYSQCTASGLLGRQGALIDDVLEGGPAAGAGLKIGDIVLALDGTAVESPDHLIRLIGAAGPGRKIEIAFARQNVRQTTRVDLAARRHVPNAPPPTAFSFRGATLRTGGPAVAAGNNASQHALLVLLVDEGSPADRAGLTPGDIITQIQGNIVRPDAEAILKAAPGDVLLGLTSGKSVLVKARSGR